LISKARSSGFQLVIVFKTERTFGTAANCGRGDQMDRINR